MIVSKLKEIGPVTFPKAHKNRFVFMQPFTQSVGMVLPDMKPWAETVDDMMRGIVWNMQAFLYINEMEMKKGEREQSRPGWNLWGNWMPNPPNGALYNAGIHYHSAYPRPMLTETIIVATDQPYYEVTVGAFQGEPTFCGALNHLYLTDGHAVQLEPNVAYAMRPDTAWRIKPIEKTGPITMARIHIPHLAFEEINNGARSDEPKPDNRKVILLW